MTPTEILVHEHRVILLVLGASEREAQKIGQTGQVDADRAHELADT